MTPTDAAVELGHAHIYVRALDRSIAFYTRILGLRETERLGEAMAFLSSSEKHHTLALQAVGEAAGPQPPGTVGLYHLAFELPDAASLDDALARLDEEDAAWQAVDHGISWAVYFDDPDGNGLELYVDRRHLAGGRSEWRGLTTTLPRERVRLAAAADRGRRAPRNRHTTLQPMTLEEERRSE